MARLWTRRNALTAFAGMAALGSFGMVGCGKSSSSSTTNGNGYASDCEVKDYPVELKFIVDDELAWYTGSDGEPRLDALLAKYQQGDGRSQVTLNCDYVPYADIARMAEEGFSGYDAVIGFSNALAAGYTKGTIEGGETKLSVRSFPTAFGVTMHVVTSASSPVDMPAAKTTNGKDSSDGSSTQLHNIGATARSIALCDASSVAEGIAANALLSQCKLYADGAYAESIADKVVLFDSQDDAMAAVASGQCNFGFAFTANLAERYPGVSDCYSPRQTCGMVFEGAALPESSEMGVARDFMQYLSTYAG